jgi:hypothetical protein
MYDPMVPCRFRIGRLSGPARPEHTETGESVVTDPGDFLYRHPTHLATHYIYRPIKR